MHRLYHLESMYKHYHGKQEQFQMQTRQASKLKHCLAVVMMGADYYGDEVGYVVALVCPSPMHVWDLMKTDEMFVAREVVQRM